MKRPAVVIPTWKAEMAVDRAESCIVFLAVHGLLSGSEKAKVRGRLQKAVDEFNARQQFFAPEEDT
jgi:hypothetical protein